MDLYILNSDFNTIGIIDAASSVIWSERFYDVGDFEIYAPATAKTISLLHNGIYVKRMDSDMVGIIERIKVTTDVEAGDYITASGRDLKSLLDRRIIWNQTNLSDKTELIMRRLIDENVINPELSERQMPGIVLGEIKGFEEAAELQSMGENLLEKIISLCKLSEIGWKAYLNNDNQIVIDFYRGANRSYSQSENPYVVFSPEFDNLLGTETSEDLTTLKNVALVAGEGEGINQKKTSTGESSGLSRRELFIAATDISSNNGEIAAETYIQLLQERGKEQLAAAVELFSISGTAETSLTYKPNEDYFLGDIVAVGNEYGITANAKILEIIECEDESGISIIPTFEEWR